MTQVFMVLETVLASAATLLLLGIVCALPLGENLVYYWGPPYALFEPSLPILLEPSFAPVCCEAGCPVGLSSIPGQRHTSGLQSLFARPD